MIACLNVQRKASEFRIFSRKPSTERTFQTGEVDIGTLTSDSSHVMYGY